MLSMQSVYVSSMSDVKLDVHDCWKGVYSRTMNIVKQLYGNGVTSNPHPHGKHHAPERAQVVGHLDRR